METQDVVTIEIEHLSGEFSLELKLELRTSDIVGDLYGSKMMLSADGVRVTIPASILEAHRELVARLVEKRTTAPPLRREDQPRK